MAGESDVEQRLSHLEALVTQPSEPSGFWNIKARTIVQTLVGGVVAGALIWGFALDNLLKLHQSSEIERKRLVQEALHLTAEREFQAERYLELQEQLELQTSKREELEKQQTGLNGQVEKLQSAHDNAVSASKSISEQIASLHVQVMQAKNLMEAQDANVDSLNGIDTSIREISTAIESSTAALNKIGEIQTGAAARHYLAVIASVRETDDLSARIESLKERFPSDDIVAFQPRVGSEWQAVSLGGAFQDKQTAEDNVKRARANGIADAYAAAYDKEPKQVTPN